MAPTTSLHITTNMQIANSAPPTRPLDVLFYVGLGVIAVMLVWFSIYMAMKIYVLLGSSAWLGCCARRKVRPDSLRFNEGDAGASPLPAPDFARRYHSPYLDSPGNSAGPTTPEDKHQGLGIDFGDASPILQLYGGPANDADSSGQVVTEQSRDAEASRDSVPVPSPPTVNFASQSTIGVAR